VCDDVDDDDNDDDGDGDVGQSPTAIIINLPFSLCAYIRLVLFSRTLGHRSPGHNITLCRRRLYTLYVYIVWYIVHKMRLIDASRNPAVIIVALWLFSPPHPHLRPNNKRFRFIRVTMRWWIWDISLWTHYKILLWQYCLQMYDRMKRI